MKITILFFQKSYYLFYLLAKYLHHDKWLHANIKDNKKYFPIKHNYIKQNKEKIIIYTFKFL